MFLTGTLLLSGAHGADAGWLDRVRGVELGATGIGIGAYVVHEVSVIQSLKQNAEKLIDLFGDMLPAVEEGDTKKAEEIWSDVEKVPADILKEAFPVFRVADAASVLAGKVRERLASAKRHIERFMRRDGGIDPRSAIATSEDEYLHYASTGIFGDNPLPSVHYYPSTGAGTEPPWSEARKDEPQSDASNYENYYDNVEQTVPISSGSTEELLDIRGDYESSLKSLEKLWVGSEADKADRASETEEYQDVLKALDRRRSELANERRQQLSENHSDEQSERPASSPEVATIGSVAPKVTSDEDYRIQSERREGWTEMSCEFRRMGDDQFECRVFSFRDEWARQSYQMEPHEYVKNETNCNGEFSYGNSCSTGVEDFICTTQTDNMIMIQYFTIPAAFPLGTENNSLSELRSRLENDVCADGELEQRKSSLEIMRRFATEAAIDERHSSDGWFTCSIATPSGNRICVEYLIPDRSRRNQFISECANYEHGRACGNGLSCKHAGEFEGEMAITSGGDLEPAEFRRECLARGGQLSQ